MLDMPELRRAIVYESGEETSWYDPDPLDSAILFKALSDRILELKTDYPNDCSNIVPAVVHPVEARDAINEVLGEIDEGMVVSGVGKPYEIGGRWPVTLPAGDLETPTEVSIQSRWFDWTNNHRLLAEDERDLVDDDGAWLKTAVFSDGHVDYRREIKANLAFRADLLTNLYYEIERWQKDQGSPTELKMHVWSGRSPMSYLDYLERKAPLTVEQELRVLRLFQGIGGISLDGAKTAPVN